MSTERKARIEQAVSAEYPRTLDLLRRLVNQPSIEANEAAIRACVDMIADEIAPFAVDVLRPVHGGLPNLVARFGGGPPERRLTFAGHIDVVPAPGDWSSPPFAFTVDGESARGRGVTDMKAGVAASVGAVRALALAGLLDECSVELAITPDEEVGSRRGMRALIASGQIAGKMAICGEPTGLAVYLGNRGIGRYRITILGRGGHSGQTHVLDNPVPVALAVCQAIGALDLPTRDERFDPPVPSITVTVIDAGAADRMINIVPDRVDIGVDRRLLPDESIDAEAQRVHDLLAELVTPPFRFDFEVLERWPACATPPDALISRAAARAVRAVGRPDEFGMDLAGNDSSFLVEAGIPALLLGPGAPEQAHVTDETLDLNELRDAIAIYAHLAHACVHLES